MGGWVATGVEGSAHLHVIEGGPRHQYTKLVAKCEDDKQALVDLPVPAAAVVAHAAAVPRAEPHALAFALCLLRHAVRVGAVRPSGLTTEAWRVIHSLT